jgi:hypothetical protein
MLFCAGPDGLVTEDACRTFEQRTAVARAAIEAYEQRFSIAALLTRQAKRMLLNLQLDPADKLRIIALVNYLLLLAQVMRCNMIYGLLTPNTVCDC